MIPIVDADGLAVQLYGRKIRDDLRAGTPLHLYLPGRASRRVQPGGVAGVREVILCESLIDALSFWVNGHRHVTAAYGVEGFTGEHLAAFKQHQTERVLIAYDRDQAGDRAAAKLAERLGGEGVECFRVLFPQGQDANSFASGSMIRPARSPSCSDAVWLGSAHASASRPAPAQDASRISSRWPSADYQGAGPAAEPFVDTGTPGRSTSRRREPASSSSLAAEPSEELRLGKGTDPEPSPTSSVSASPVPAGPRAGPVARLEGEELRVQIDGRGWRVRGLGKVTSFEVLRLNVLVAVEHEHRGHLFHVDSFDLYSARARGVFCRQAAEVLGMAEELIARDLGRVLLVCEEHAEEAILAAQAPEEQAVVLSDAERTAALGLLSDPDLVGRIVGDFDRAGVVGEAANCLRRLSRRGVEDAGSAVGGDRSVDLRGGQVARCRTRCCRWCRRRSASASLR